MSKSSEVKSSEWKSKQPLMCYRNLSLQQDVSVILSQQHFQLYYGTNTHSGEMTSFSTFLKILHITSIMLIMIHLGKENSVCVACKESGGGKWGGKKYLKQVIYRGSWNNWCWAPALVPCGVVIEPSWLWHKDSQAGKKVGMQPAMIMFVGRWMFTHWPLTWSPCARSEMQAHLPVTSEEGKKWEGGGGGKKSTHWKVANYSHRNLTLAGWLQPRSRWFCTWNSARCYFWDVTWWRNPRGSDRSRTLIQNPPPPNHPHPIHSALHFIPSLPLTSATEDTQAFLTRTEDVTTTKPFEKQQECFMYENRTLKTFIGWYPINVHKCKIRSEQGRATLCERQSREILKSRDQTAWHSLLKQPWRDPFSSSQHHQLTYIPPSSQPAPPHLHSDITRLVIWQRARSESPGPAAKMTTSAAATLRALEITTELCPCHRNPPTPTPPPKTDPDYRAKRSGVSSWSYAQESPLSGRSLWTAAWDILTSVTRKKETPRRYY